MVAVRNAAGLPNDRVPGVLEARLARLEGLPELLNKALEGQLKPWRSLERACGPPL